MTAETLEEEERMRQGSGRLRREVRKHRNALIVAGLYLAIFFFPLLFMGRVVSPNDIYRHYDPWSPEDKVIAQNPVIHDPPLAYMPIVAMMKRAPEAFHWNPWLASGIPGWGSAASAVLTPFVLFPALLPLPFFYTAVILLKLLFAFWMTYLWLREERLGKPRAAIGALVGASCGPMFALWLWQSTNATVLYPALLLVITRMAHGKKNSVVALTLLGVAFLLSGYPAAIVFGLWLGLFAATVQFVRARRIPFREIVRSLAAVVLALAITVPVLDPFIDFLRRTGYLEWRSTAARASLPPEHLVGLIDANYLGNVTDGWWRGDARLGPLDNPVELTIWIGPLAAILALLALLDSKSRGRVFSWAGLGTIVILVMTGTLNFDWILELPGLRYSPATRLRVLLPPVFAFLVASGARGIGSFLRGRLPIRESLVLLGLGAILSWQYARVGADFYPYLPLDETRVESETSLERLQIKDDPFRVAPTFFYMMPNSAQIFGIEDIRSQWSSESAYREIIRRIDPQAGQSGTVLLFNGLTMNVEDPFLQLLNVRYLIEPPSIDILRWRLEERVLKRPAPDGNVVLEAGESVSVPVAFSDGTRTIELRANPVDDALRAGRVDVELLRAGTGGEVVGSVSRPLSQLARRTSFYLPVLDVDANERYELRMTARGAAFEIPYLDGEPMVRMSSSPLALVYEDEGARIYELIDTLPRYRATWELVEQPDQKLLSEVTFDFSRFTSVEVLDPDLEHRLASVPTGRRHARFRVVRYDPSDQVIETSSRVPFLFTASEKLTPELRVFVDGEEIRPSRVNGLFVGFPIEPGAHRVVFERRIGGRWWLVAVLGFLGLGGAGILDQRW